MSKVAIATASYLTVYNMKGLDKTYLYWYIKELLHFEKDIAVLSADMVIHLEVKGTPFYIFIKRITYAGNPYPQNTTRAQLPRREEFEDIKKSHAIFLFLGYDVENEVLLVGTQQKQRIG